MPKNFYQNQSPLTAAKIEIYQKYLKQYLPKILNFKTCFIADLFCGAGKNGEEKGSPLVSIDCVKYILNIPKIANSSVQILFNDQDQKLVENLKTNLEQPKANKKIEIFIYNKKFEEILPNLIQKLESEKDRPKFFFLDPYTYSNVKMSDLQQLMDLESTEVLLFLPIFHSYRFANASNLGVNHKTRKFVQEFTTKGIADYKGLDDFKDSIQAKIKQELNLKFVRPVLLDFGKRKNMLFLLTKNEAGMLAMNKVAFSVSENGKGVEIKKCNQLSLFGTQGSSEFEKFANELTKTLNTKKAMTNHEVVSFTIEQGFLPRHAKTILEKLFQKQKIKVLDESQNPIEKKNQWNIAEKISKNVTFHVIPPNDKN